MNIKITFFSNSDSPYRTKISEAILLLQENGIIHNLTTKWWKTKNVGADGTQVDCNAGEKKTSDTPELDMDNVGGVFLVLVVGLAVALFVGILEFVWSVRRVSIEKRVSNSLLLIHGLTIHKVPSLT